ncbi:DUF2098 domain-containing protein [Methanolobus mangrovi]|uniref:DUF2098 domain-containing protein n=1 Tax=Methanolobus mangrovi TaxID=3072977 RepID=A0AA51UEE0_9EURY|nr:DUF2098 domain-containing protein [Methanolobus mangrovi]WMW21428.1 DUF2098 domain-containing protein [Methanolobus mangrovi]
MADSKTIEALDMGGNPIVIDSVVRYLNTGTVGKVIDLKEDEDGIWVLVDATGLYYKPETLVIADVSDLKEERAERSSIADAESYMRTYGGGDDGIADVGQVTGGG